MRVTHAPGGPVVSNKFSPAGRVIGVAMLASSIALIAAVALSPVYNFWTFSAAVFLTVFLFLPGVYFTLYVNEVILDLTMKRIYVRRGWITGSVVADYDFSEIKSVLSAHIEKGRTARKIRLFLIILRMSEGGLVFSSPTPDEPKNAALVEKLARILDKPVEHVKQKEDGDGFVPA
jgi:hypothetical protein